MATSIRPGETPVHERSLGELFATASRDLSLLVHKEVELAKAELTVDAKRAGVGAGFLGTAGFFGMLAVIFVSIAAAFGIAALGLTLGWGFLIVAGCYLLAALVLAAGGATTLRKIAPPRRTIQTVKDDIALVRRPTSAAGPAPDAVRSEVATSG